jgi:hypothetical protein
MELKKFCKVLKKFSKSKKPVSENQFIDMMNAIIRQKDFFEKCLNIGKETNGKVKFERIKYIDDGKDDIYINFIKNRRSKK